MIVLLLLAHDEADLIRRNIEHHLDWGVDHIAVGDHASRDDTQDVLHSFGDQVSTVVFRDFMDRQKVRIQMLTDLRAHHTVDWAGVSDSDEFFWKDGVGPRELLAAVPSDRVAVSYAQKLFLPTARDYADGPVECRRVYRTTGPQSPLHTSYRMGKSFYRGDWLQTLTHEHWCPEVPHDKGTEEPVLHHFMIQSEDQFVDKVKRLRSWQSIRRQRLEDVKNVFRRVAHRPIPSPVGRDFKARWWDVYQAGGESGLREYYRSVYTLDAHAIDDAIAAGDLAHDPSFAQHLRSRAEPG
ncbi:MAG TPA: glycosyltransferase family 2 protein [Acidimicrobiia bacterium]|nr:glycosyltransferase family 2 protein [Acidimicrobiia bacterium]